MDVGRRSPTLDRVFQALADASRRDMVNRLAHGPASVSELARPLAMALPSVLKHLAVLEAAGLVLSDKTGRVRTFRVAPGAFSAIEAWVAGRKARLGGDPGRPERHGPAKAAHPTAKDAR